MGGALVTKHVVSYFQRRAGNAVFAVHFTVKPFNQLYITNKTERFSFKSGRAMRVAKLIKEDWPIYKTAFKSLSLKYWSTKHKN